MICLFTQPVDRPDIAPLRFSSQAICGVDSPQQKAPLSNKNHQRRLAHFRPTTQQIDLTSPRDSDLADMIWATDSGKLSW